MFLKLFYNNFDFIFILLILVGSFDGRIDIEAQGPCNGHIRT